MDWLGLEGAWLYTPRIHCDDRGHFLESFRARELTAETGYRFGTAQVNCSVSSRGVIRGIHFADVPPGQAKYVSCVRGAMIDVVVDVRTGSPTFGQWRSVLLDDQDRRSVFIAEGLGHAFMALTDECQVMYLCSTPYTPGREHGVHPLDPAIGIAWPSGVEPILSDKDGAALLLAEARDSGLLPSYADCGAGRATLAQP